MGRKKKACETCDGLLYHTRHIPGKGAVPAPDVCPAFLVQDRERVRERSARRMNERRTRGLCVSCGSTAVTEYLCGRCAERVSKYGVRYVKNHRAKAKAFDIFVGQLEAVSSWWSAQCNGEEAELPEWTTAYPEMEETA